MPRPPKSPIDKLTTTFAEVIDAEPWETLRPADTEPLPRPPKSPIDKLTTTFAEVIDAEPWETLRPADTEPPLTLLTEAAPSAAFKMGLLLGGIRIGWLGWTQNSWAIPVADLNDAVILTPVDYQGQTYYGANARTEWWLSVTNGGEVGFYKWASAVGWTMEGDHFKCNYDQGYLSILSPSDGYLWTHGRTLDISVEPAYTTPIKHVFVLMLENRSFDHMLGFSGITGTDAQTGQRRSIDGLHGIESNDFQGRTYTVSQPADWTMPCDPNHEFSNVVTQLCGPGASYQKGMQYPPIVNTGFAADYATVPNAGNPGELMKCYNPAQLPAIMTLAKEFAVCDKWFSSMPGPTWPNRFFVNAASAGGLEDSPTTEQIAEWNTVNGFKFEHGTLFSQQGLQWDIYVGNMLLNNCGALAGVHRLLDIKQFKDFAGNIRDGEAKQYTFIEPDYGDVLGNTYRGGNSQHPMDDMRSGNDLVAEVYNTIRNSRIWESSMLIITWDEHGGFYDHVAPPPAPSPGDQPQMSGVNVHGFPFGQYGVRVPAVIVSPLIARNVIDGRIYDHASIPATVEALFHLNPLTKRDEMANDLAPLLTLQTARTDCPTSVPQIPRLELSNAFPKAREIVPLAAALEAKKHEPINQGNLPGFVYSAMRLHLELASPDQKAAIIARVAGLRTVGDADAYMEEVRQMLSAAPSAKDS